MIWDYLGKHIKENRTTDIDVDKQTDKTDNRGRKAIESTHALVFTNEEPKHHRVSLEYRKSRSEV
jgi:hypothetical protein